MNDPSSNLQQSRLICTCRNVATQKLRFFAAGNVRWSKGAAGCAEHRKIRLGIPDSCYVGFSKPGKREECAQACALIGLLGGDRRIEARAVHVESIQFQFG